MAISRRKMPAPLPMFSGDVVRGRAVVRWDGHRVHEVPAGVLGESPRRSHPGCEPGMAPDTIRG
ncbi:hypothetical protein FYZ44_06965 [Mobiluncus mulieris]|nr:hypothetical protein [Mobiluncus mulieris]